MRVNPLKPVIWLCLLGACFSLSVDLRRTKVESNSQWTRVRLQADGGRAPYSFSFTQLPQLWRQINGYIYLPNTILSTQTRFPVRFIVRDKFSDQFSATVILASLNKKLWLQETLYPYDHVFPADFFTSGSYAGQPETVQHPDLNADPTPQLPRQSIDGIGRSTEESTELVSTPGSGLASILRAILPQEKEAENVIDEIVKAEKLIAAEVRATSQSRSIESIFLRFPTAAELDQIIISGDGFAISKTIQSVLTSEQMDCYHKIAYLADFFGRIQSAVSMKEFTLAQLKVIIEGAEKEIQRLANEIQRSKDQIRKLDLAEMRTTLQAEIIALQAMYDEFNENDQLMLPLEEELIEVERGIEHKQVQMDAARSDIRDKQLALVNADNAIAELERQLADARTRRNQIDEQLGESESKLHSLEFELSAMERNKQTIELRIEQLNALSDKLKADYSTQEIVVERLTGENVRAFEKESKAVMEVREMERRLFIEEQKLVYREVEILSNLISLLSRNLPNIQEDVDSIYYSCFNTTDIDSSLQQGSIVYRVGARSLQKYIENAYRAVIESPISSEFTITVSHILSASWQQAFGVPFHDSSLISSKQFIHPSDFNCLRPSTLQRGEGIITEIKANKIFALMDLETVVLKLGACSRIESVTRLPEVGQTIFFRGNYVDEREFEVYACLSI